MGEEKLTLEELRDALVNDFQFERAEIRYWHRDKLEQAYRMEREEEEADIMDALYPNGGPDWTAADEDGI